MPRVRSEFAQGISYVFEERGVECVGLSGDAASGLGPFSILAREALVMMLWCSGHSSHSLHYLWDPACRRTRDGCEYEMAYSCVSSTPAQRICTNSRHASISSSSFLLSLFFSPTSSRMCSSFISQNNDEKKNKLKGN